MARGSGPQGYRNNSKYVEFLWQPFKYSHNWSSITFKWFKIEAYYLRWKCCPWKQLSENVWHRAVSPRGVAKCEMCCVLRIFFMHCHFPPLHTLHLSSPLSSATSSLLFHPCRPVPMEMNKELNYRASWKHTNAIPSANVYCFFPYTNLEWPKASCCQRRNVAKRVMFSTSPLVRPSVRSSVRPSFCPSVLKCKCQCQFI